eukprot:CAMPEP_0168584438 /NCGR_PEP_ID=MMETSP0420-20121227/3137_1 /TAXON_ID=498008 /ORGANISM="Pessonella sp." /LENGTH=204 /DNA_ID=CAMNT_0008619235 /DNA_START=135 /DNA_END=745 /DNA_ORIENTATION=-
MLKLFAVVLFNQFAIGMPMTMIMYKLYDWRGCFAKPVPSIATFLTDLVIFVLIEEFLFFYSHWLMHTKYFYKPVHKLHHEWQESCALVCIYAHPIEHIISNLFPVMIGPFVTGSHPFSMMAWYIIALGSTLNSHSGFHFPFAPSPEEHDWHHAKFTENFGVLQALDTWHATNLKFVKSIEKQRAGILWSLEPLVHKDYLQSFSS